MSNLLGLQVVVPVGMPERVRNALLLLVAPHAHEPPARKDVHDHNSATIDIQRLRSRSFLETMGPVRDRILNMLHAGRHVEQPDNAAGKLGPSWVLGDAEDDHATDRVCERGEVERGRAMGTLPTVRPLLELQVQSFLAA